MTLSAAQQGEIDDAGREWDKRNPGVRPTTFGERVLDRLSPVGGVGVTASANIAALAHLDGYSTAKREMAEEEAETYTIQVPPDRDWFQVVDGDGEVVCSGHSPSIHDIQTILLHVGRGCEFQEVDPETLG